MSNKIITLNEITSKLHITKFRHQVQSFDSDLSVTARVPQQYISKTR